MAVFYKFKSAKDFDSLSIDGQFITLLNLKERIFKSKQLGRGTDYDLVVINAQTNEEYIDEAMLIPNNTSVLIRRLPGVPRKPIVTGPPTNREGPAVESKPENAQPVKNIFMGADQSIYVDGSEFDEFEIDLYEIPETAPAIPINPVQDAPPPSKAEEDSKIQALIDTPALDWQQTFDGFGHSRGFMRGMSGRMGGRSFGRGGFEQKTPPEGYVCHRCKIPGHFIQHCPTNGDPNFDIKRLKRPTGIPRSMLMPTPDGLYALPNGVTAVFKPNEAAFEKEIEGLPGTCNVGELPPELHCPLCKEVMKDAVLTSKCCFRSFCDKCIRDQIISEETCICGASDILADDLVPNKTVRDTISRLSESSSSSAEKGRVGFHAQDMESARCAAPLPKVPSPSLSAASNGDQSPSVQATAEHYESPVVQQEVLEKGRVTAVLDVYEVTHDLRSRNGPALQGSARPADEEMQHRQLPGEAGKKMKKKKVHLPPNASEMQWRNPQDSAPESFMMPLGSPPYNPYWSNMQPGMEAFMGPYVGFMPPYMGYMVGPSTVPFGTAFPQDPFGVPGNMMPPLVLPQRDLEELAIGRNAGPPISSREEFEARKVELRRKLEPEKHDEREVSKNHESCRKVGGSAGVSSMKLKRISTPPRLQPSTTVHHHRYHQNGDERRHGERTQSRERRHRERTSRAALERKSDDYNLDDIHHNRRHGTAGRPRPAPRSAEDKVEEEPAVADKTHSKKRKAAPSSSEPEALGSMPHGKDKASPSSKEDHLHHHYYKKSSSAAASGGYDTSDDDDDERHFKRRPKRFAAGERS